MSAPQGSFPSYKSLNLLSRILLQPHGNDESSLRKMEELRADVARVSKKEFADLLELANLNHVVIRGMNLLLELAPEAPCAVWARQAVAEETARIDAAVAYLSNICQAFADAGLEVSVIKSLDHWPDLGSDLDLFTSARPDQVIDLMKRKFDAETEARSWGDRLACKWNFKMPGLPESVEVHVGRLGQTGEQVAIASSLLKRTRTITVDGRNFRVASKSDRLLISTLQRMYRHFYFRLCDIIDSDRLVEVDGVDFQDLRAAARAADIWEGTATYLAIVSDYVESYRGTRIELPQFVREAARFGGNSVYYARGFIRVPIMPQSARLYGSQLMGIVRKGELHNGARLSLLPWLATAAAVGMKITGSDKGIW